MVTSFNPRTYIRYDTIRMSFATPLSVFQSTYLYKVRHAQGGILTDALVVSIHVPI